MVVLTKSVGMIGVGATGLASFGIMVRRSGPKTPTAIAGRAFALGTMLCLSTFSLTGGLVAYSLNVNTLREFGDAMKAWLPEKRRRFQAALGIESKDTTSPEEDEAWAHIENLIEQALRHDFRSSRK